MRSIIVLFLICLVLIGFQALNPRDDTEIEETSADTQTDWPERKTPQPFIIGGVTAVPGDVPWFVLIEIMINADEFRTCSGAILNKTTVISAAGCFEEVVPTQLRLRCGATTIADGIQANVSRIIRHPKYMAPGIELGIDYDIALLILKTAIQLNNTTVKAIKLPAKDIDIKDGTVVLFAGFGKTVMPNVPLPNLALQMANLKTKRTCLNVETEVTGRQICASAFNQQSRNRTTTCTGDEGGPLTLNGTNTLVGVLIVTNCKLEKGGLSIFTRVSEFLDFIKYYNKPK